VCREAYPRHDIKVHGHNTRHTKQTIGLSFSVNRPGTGLASARPDPS
jgi:hypothetical protein